MFISSLVYRLFEIVSKSPLIISISVLKVISIKQVLQNPDLPYNFPNNDWEVLKLSEPLKMGDQVKAACLPPDTSYLPTTATKDQCYTSGWGMTIGTQCRL